MHKRIHKIAPFASQPREDISGLSWTSGCGVGAQLRPDIAPSVWFRTGHYLLHMRAFNMCLRGLLLAQVCRASCLHFALARPQLAAVSGHYPCMTAASLATVFCRAFYCSYTIKATQAAYSYCASRILWLPMQVAVTISTALLCHA